MSLPPLKNPSIKQFSLLFIFSLFFKGFYIFLRKFQKLPHYYSAFQKNNALQIGILAQPGALSPVPRSILGS